jgi:putative ABC transport system permease protein
MMRERLMHVSERWFRLLLRLYPRDFREEMGPDMVDAFRSRVHSAAMRRGAIGLMWECLRALTDSMRNGLGERLRPAADWRRRGNWGRDLELARRRLWRSKLFTATTLATLTIGLGAFAVVFTAVDRVLIEPLPYRDPDRLYFVWRDRSASSGLKREWLTGPDVAELQASQGVIDGAAAMQLAGPTLSMRRDGEPLQITLMTASPNLFDLLGVAPMLGRDFAATEVGPSRPSIVILSHAIWKRLGGDPSIVGSQVWMSGSAYTVIGVMGPNFRFVRHSTIGPPQEPDVYTTLRVHVADQDPNTTSFGGLFGALIRIRSGASHAQVAAAVDAAARAVNERKHPSQPVRLYPVGLQADLVAPVRPVLITLGVAGLVLLLVLTVNFASLLLARVAQREREFAVSRALGASRSTIVRAMVFEGALLGVVGGAAGALAGSWGARTLVALAPLELPRRDEIALDWRIAVVIVVAGLIVGGVAAALPSLWAARVSLASLIAPSAVRGSGGSQRMRRGVIVAQVALTLVLLCAGGLVARSLERLLAADPGFRPAGVLTFAVAMGPRLFPKDPEAFAFQERVENALAALPGVRTVSATTSLPLSGSAGLTTISIPGAPGNTGDPQRDAIVVDVISTRARYAELIGMRVLAGRAFDSAHRADVREVLIDRHLASQFFPTGTPLGASIPLDRHSNIIVGVVDQARLYNLHQDGRPQIFVRAEDWTPYMPYFVLKTDGNPEALVPDVRRVIRQIDPRIPVSSVRTMDDIVNDALRQPRISTVLIGGFALGALLLVALGVFGLIAGSVANRHGELAVRIALGASHQRLLRLVVGEGALLVGIGMLIAVPGIFASGGFIRGLLVGVTPWDPATLMAVALGLALVTMTACYVPARKVLALDPAPALRQQ